MVVWTLLGFGLAGLVVWCAATIYQQLILTRVQQFKDSNGIVMKGTKPTFLVGDVLSNFFFPPSLDTKNFLHFGDVYYRWFFWRPTIVVVDHESVKRILDDSSTYRKNVPNRKYSYSDDFDAETQARDVKAVFSANHMEVLYQSVTDMADNLLNQLVDTQGKGVPFNVHETSIDYVREVLGTIIYGESFPARQIITAQRELSEISPLRTFIRSLFPSAAKMAPYFFGIEQATELTAGYTKLATEPTPGTIVYFLHEVRKKQQQQQKGKKGSWNKEEHRGEKAGGQKSDREEQRLEEDVREFVRDREPADGDLENSKAEEEEEDEEEVRVRKLRMKQTMANVIAFYTSGTDSTASVLTSTLYMLMKHPEIQEKLRDEIMKAEAEDPQSSLSYKKLKDIKLLTNVIKETLRMYPPYPILYPRISRRADKLGGYTIPPKTHIIIDAVGHNRHPKYWSNPDEFNPSRFEQNPTASKYVLAWGSGPQEKVARSLAMVTLRATLATLLRRYKIIPDPTYHAPAPLLFSPSLPLSNASSFSSAFSERAERVRKEKERKEGGEGDLPGVHFSRSVVSLRPKPALIARVAAVDA